ncbi:MAG: CDP-glycerol glycerophosphotransferase family protein [Hyphomicrobiales bacterium]
MLERFDGSDAPLDLLTNALAYLFRVNSVFFRTDIIERFDVRFDPRIRPHFEDAEYVNRYLCFAGNFTILPLTGAKYYYREREAGTSLMDRCWRDPDKFGVILTAGYLALLKLYRQKFGRTPRFVENLVLGEILGYLRVFYDCDDRLPFISHEDSAAFEAKLAAVLELIDIDTILERDGISHSDKVGLLMRFKGITSPEQIVRVDRVDPDNKLIKLRFYDDGSSHVEIQLNGQIVAPRFERTIVHMFNRRPFLTERIFWLEASELSTLAATVNKRGAKLTLLETKYSVLTATDVKLASRLHQHVASGLMPRSAKWLVRLAKSTAIRSRYCGAWLFSDRPGEADDNAEHLYRWMLQNSQASNRMWFVLPRRGRDWKRLKREGFKLLPYGGLRHRLAFLNSDWIISSHASPAISDPFGYSQIQSPPQFAFLQHGVTDKDSSAWLNTASVDLFVTSAEGEVTGLLNGPFDYSMREIALTGMPRHDALLGRANTERDLILIMPTWRPDLANPNQSASDFERSDYYRAWQALIADERFAAIARQHQLEVVFIPHPALRLCHKHFHPADGVNLMQFAPNTLQDLFARCALFITDYSSVAFDLALLHRPIIYYQFDRDTFYQTHFVRGYFDHQRDGFGPVVEQHATLIASIRAQLSSGAGMASEHRERAQRFFAFRDGQNCRRVFDAIMARDRALRGKNSLGAEAHRPGGAESSVTGNPNQ